MSHPKAPETVEAPSIDARLVRKLADILKDLTARTTLIGPGGENLVRFACVVNDISHFAGRTGVGAVMDSDGTVISTQLFATVSYSQLATRDRFNRF